MSLPSNFFLGLLAWFAAEFAAFVIVAQNIGLGGALLIGMATSLAGFALLGHAGGDALEQLRSALTGASPKKSDMFDGVIRALAAVLLILPGFISDLAGLALAAPSVRQLLARRIGGSGLNVSGRRPASQGIVDLAPDEWIAHDQTAEPLRR
jgi:UPF0716 protein FxsA